MRCAQAVLMTTQVLGAVGMPDAMSTLRAVSAGFERLQVVKEFRSAHAHKGLRGCPCAQTDGTVRVSGRRSQSELCYGHMWLLYFPSTCAQYLL